MSYIAIISETDATGELAELYRRTGNPDGTVDNVMKVHALNPASLRAHFDLYVQSMHKPSPLSRAEREMVAVTVSRINSCDYCRAHHLAGLKRLLPSERHIAADAIALGKRGGLSNREQAMVDYAAKLTRSPQEMTGDDVDALRNAGLDDRAILDLAQCIGYFNYVNRIVTGLGVSMEGEAGQPGQWPEDDIDTGP